MKQSIIKVEGPCATRFGASVWRDLLWRHYQSTGREPTWSTLLHRLPPAQSFETNICFEHAVPDSRLKHGAPCISTRKRAGRCGR